MNHKLFMRILQVAYDYEFFFLAKTRLYKEGWVVFNPKMDNYILHVCIWNKGWCNGWIFPTCQEYGNGMDEIICAGW